MQREYNDSRSCSRRGRWGVALVAALALTTTGCDSLLDVENPNNVIQSDLEDASSVNALVNGALALAADAIGDLNVSTTALSDEVYHTGSQNWAAELVGGSITNPEGRSNEVFNELAEARWMADEAIGTAEEFAAELTVPSDLARANLISGMVYMTIADNMEDFTFSNRTEVAPPIGESNMQSVYDIALDRLSTAESEAAAVGATNIVLASRALQARTHWARALWPKLNPPGSAPADPLINDAQANALAEQVLASLPEPDWTYDLGFSSSSQSNPMGSWIINRREFQVSNVYVQLNVSGREVEAITLLDPVEGIPDPTLEATIFNFLEQGLYPPLTVVSAREMHLILAEAALASGDDAAAQGHLNDVRALRGVAAYDASANSDTSLMELLQHERQVNLFFQPTRRIWDMYRFDVDAPTWAPGSDATRNGQLFIIGQDESVSNCYILGTCS